MIPDDPDDIIRTVRDFSSRFDVVFTTGGIGPTHDDLTVHCVAAALQSEVIHHPGIVERLEAHFGAALTEGQRRLARVPECSELVGGEGGAWPTIRAKNVYIFPGIPDLFRAKFQGIEHLLGGVVATCSSLQLDARESDIVGPLEAVVARHPAVEIGSYPRLEGTRWLVRLTVESVSAADVHAAHSDLEQTFAGRVIAATPPHSAAKSDG